MRAKAFINVVPSTAQMDPSSVLDTGGFALAYEHYKQSSADESQPIWMIPESIGFLYARMNVPADERTFEVEEVDGDICLPATKFKVGGPYEENLITLDIADYPSFCVMLPLSEEGIQMCIRGLPNSSSYTDKCFHVIRASDS
ncbi:hypothetical protein EGR_08737 [Echinococcus granulosus]|uniref:Uncharacterized protein n=1 Tax=Echinococcus granulosus TaxID=6210 RepID=W6U5G9_ECHGR|nr:hypothetical protein EGR_08737 [Echinococcus granulosus]EUB56423.1 hypothetical protein EGR_08737 [Echinococcus granulosus]